MSEKAVRKVLEHAREGLRARETFFEENAQNLVDIARTMALTLTEGGKVLFCGNGGSASTASHMAAALGKNTVFDGRTRLRVLSLNDNMAWFSALANALGFENVFVEQMENLLQPGDLLIAISASGNSPNVVRAAEFAQAHGGRTIALVGFTGGRLREICDVVVHLPSSDYGQVEDGHLVLNHIFTAALRDRVRSGS